MSTDNRLTDRVVRGLVLCLVGLVTSALSIGPAFAAKQTTKKPTSGKSAATKAPAKLTGKAARSKTKKASVSISSLRQQRLKRDRVRAKRAKAAKSVSSAKASSAAAAASLERATRRTQQASLEYERSVRSQKRATKDARTARAEEVRLESRLAKLRERQLDAAIVVFSSGFAESADSVLSSESASEASRLSELGSLGRSRSADIIDELNAVNEDLTLQRRIAERAEERAKKYREDVADRLTELEAIKRQRQDLADNAEERLEQHLSELQGLAELDKSISAQVAQEAAILQRQLRSAGVGGRSRGSYDGASIRDIVTSSGGGTHGIRVAPSIQGQLAAMLAAAKRDGIYFTGGGYRSVAIQVQLRRSHCGSSSFAIYQMRSSQCRPPTARPGFSQHERGLAIDFAVNGQGLHRGSAGYRWLKQNAWRYGFKNLPSEPWHWSTTGR